MPMSRKSGRLLRSSAKALGASLVRSLVESSEKSIPILLLQRLLEDLLRSTKVNQGESVQDANVAYMLILSCLQATLLNRVPGAADRTLRGEHLRGGIRN